MAKNPSSRAAAMNDRLARRASKQVNPRRLELLEQILEESSSQAINDVARQTTPGQALEAHSRLLSLILELKQVESSCNIELPKRNPKSWENFYSWFEGQTGKSLTKELDIREIGQMNGSSNGALSDEKEFALITKVPRKKGDIIFEIPRDIMLSTETVARDTNLFDFIMNDSIASGMQNVVLVLHLLNEFSKGEKSYWWPYLSILPSKILPVLKLNEASMKCLMASAHFFESLKMIRAISRQYSYFFKRLQATNLPLTRDFTLEYYCWGVSVVCSRQNEIPPSSRIGAPVPVVHALIPILDMCNHNRLSNQATFEANKSKLAAINDLAEGDEVTINYGIRSGGEFYIHNGFVPEVVPFDIVPLNIILKPDSPMYEIKRKLLKMLNMPHFGRFKLTKNDYESRHKRDPHLTMFLIVQLLNQDELNLIMGNPNPVGIADQIYSFVQYQEQSSQDTAIFQCQTRISVSIKEYMSKRAAISIALINRAIAEHPNIEKDMLSMLNLEKSIYSSHIIKDGTGD